MNVRPLSLLCALVLAAGALFCQGCREGAHEEPPPARRPPPPVVQRPLSSATIAPPVPSVPTPAPSRPARPAKPAVSRADLPRLVIVIDDVGNTKEQGEAVFAMRELTPSILPGLPFSRYFADKARQSGRRVLVHVPMEPHGAKSYAPEQLETGMTDSAIRSLSARFLDDVPSAVGANNHTGSKFTEDAGRMDLFLHVLKERGLFFLDSRTSASSRGADRARALGIETFSRDVFLDHDISVSAISRQLDKAVEIARERGFAIAIGHPHRETLDVIRRRLPELSGQVRIVPLGT